MSKSTESQQPHRPDAEPRSVRNFRIAGELYDFAYALIKFKLSRKHPDCTPDQLHNLTIASLDRACHG